MSAIGQRFPSPPPLSIAAAAQPALDQMIEKMIIQDVVRALQDKEGQALNTAESNAIATNYKLAPGAIDIYIARAETILQSPAQIEEIDRFVDAISEEDHRQILALIEAAQVPVENPHADVDQILKKVIRAKVIDALQNQQELQAIAISFYIPSQDMDKVIRTAKAVLRDKTQYENLKKDVQKINADERNIQRIQSRVDERRKWNDERVKASMRALEIVKEWIGSIKKAEIFEQIKAAITGSSLPGITKRLALQDLDMFQQIFKQFQQEWANKRPQTVSDITPFSEREEALMKAEVARYQRRWNDLYELIAAPHMERDNKRQLPPESSSSKSKKTKIVSV